MTSRPVRTPEEPMAFSRDEFLRGAAIAFFAYPLWGAATIAVSVLPSDPAQALTWLPVFVLSLGFGALPWTLGALIAGLVPAWYLGRGLRRVRRKAWHVAAFALLGAVLGALTLLAAVLIGAAGPLTPEFFVSQIIAGALTVATGWWTTARWALHPKPPSRRRARVDRDAAVEDRIVDAAG